MATIYGANEIKSTGYDVANSVRMNAADSAKMAIDFGSAGNRRTFTISCWVKRARITPDDSQTILSNYADVNNFCNFTLSTTDKLSFVNRDGGTFNVNVATSRLFRDPSAWYHIMVAVDTTQGTASNRVKLYVNGTQETSLSSTTYPSQDTELKFNTTDTTNFGSWSGSAQYADGYYAELVFIDGSALTPSSFGEFDSDSPTTWKPIDVSGLTFGTNGFYLDFEDSSNLGNDANGGTDLTETNLAATDQSTDTCTNNYINMNPIDHSASTNSTFSEGNLKVVTAASGSPPHFATFGLEQGKWYWEVKATSFTEDAAGYICIGITGNQGNSTTNQLGHLSGDYAFVNNGQIQAGTGNDTSYGNTYTQGQIIGVYMDLDNNKLYFSINGTLQNSGTGHSILAPSATTAGFYMPSFSDYSSSSSNLVTVEFNFGAGTTFSISSGNSDPAGHGNFEYSTTITGDGASKSFYAINTKNIADFG